ncbi:hypothetical protein GBAR_LOCUS18200 [Geodia barretti]|uniref:NADH dehydrogenase [ubiquinone] flavoprotein 3, mitochondrial n=1 Tax=Geodia barretti TaxID=519541 RepID=A0AA35SN37_GEOBA|nr:hypothetical protein GBAR_LOCUS18200 [Geodia barretti]
MASVFQGLWRLPLSLGSRRAPQVVVLRGLSGATSDSGSLSKTSSKISGSEYKVQEYFGYNPDSYYDFENALVKYRLKQPVPGVKY